MVDSISCDTLLLLAFARLYTLLVYYVSTHKVHLCEFVVQSLRIFLFLSVSFRLLTYPYVEVSMVYGINAFGYLAYYPAILYEHFPLEWNTTITFPIINVPSVITRLHGGVELSPQSTYN